jgi:hypothetical protein
LSVPLLAAGKGGILSMRVKVTDDVDPSFEIAIGG